MKVIFTTNFPSIYRVDFFNELGKLCDLTVLYERNRAAHRNENWFGGKADSYNEIYLNSRPYSTSLSIGTEMLRFIAKNKSDILVFSGYASPSVILSMFFCMIFKRKYYIEFDGGFNKSSKSFKSVLKNFLIRGAHGCFVTCEDTLLFLKSINMPENKIHHYPFSSVKDSDITNFINDEERKYYKYLMKIEEETALISVGSYIYRKGFDILLNSALSMSKNIGIYIVGGEPTQEYIEFVEKHNLTNVHFIPFCKKEELYNWYKACDFFVMPTREDIWGLVINEAMACGLPIISSDMCIAARELVKHEVNGYIFESENVDELSSCINKMIEADRKVFSLNCLDVIKKYTIEEMANTHMKEWKKYEDFN